MNSKKKIVAAALAGLMSFGVAGVAFSPVSEAAHHHAQREEYADGTSNQYSHALKEENDRHESTVRSINYEFRKDGDQKKHDKALKEEQKRHDKAVAKIKADSERHVRHEHKH